jgi:hypothetical protein
VATPQIRLVTLSGLGVLHLVNIAGLAVWAAGLPLPYFALKKLHRRKLVRAYFGHLLDYFRLAHVCFVSYLSHAITLYLTKGFVNCKPIIILSHVYNRFWHLTPALFLRLIAGMNTLFLPPDLDAIHVLFVLKIKLDDQKAWKDFDDIAYKGAGTNPQPALQKHDLNKKMLAENVWLLLLTKDLGVLNLLMAAADKARLPYESFLLPVAPTQLQLSPKLGGGEKT